VPGAGGSQPPGSGHGTTPLSSRTLHALSAQGAAGRGAAALAAATAPAALQHPTRGGTHGGGATPSKSAPTLPAIPAASGSNGISPALPIVLAVALMGALALMLMRRRGSRPAA
jgi:hypothetical protein